MIVYSDILPKVCGIVLIYTFITTLRRRLSMVAQFSFTELLLRVFLSSSLYDFQVLSPIFGGAASPIGWDSLLYYRRPFIVGPSAGFGGFPMCLCCVSISAPLLMRLMDFFSNRESVNKT